MSTVQKKTTAKAVVEEQYEKLKSKLTKSEIYKKINNDYGFPKPSIRRIISIYIRNDSKHTKQG